MSELTLQLTTAFYILLVIYLFLGCCFLTVDLKATGARPIIFSFLDRDCFVLTLKTSLNR